MIALFPAVVLLIPRMKKSWYKKYPRSPSRIKEKRWDFSAAPVKTRIFLEGINEKNSSDRSNKSE